MLLVGIHLGIPQPMLAQYINDATRVEVYTLVLTEGGAQLRAQAVLLAVLQLSPQTSYLYRLGPKFYVIRENGFRDQRRLAGPNARSGDAATRARLVATTRYSQPHANQQNSDSAPHPSQLINPC